MSAPSNNHVASSQLHNVPESSPLASSALNGGESQPGLNIPFQFALHNHMGEHHFHTHFVAVYHNILEFTKFGRVCQFSQLECVVLPDQHCVEVPITIDVAWTPNDVIPTQTTILSYPGAARLTAGGPVAFAPFVVPCPFESVNRVIKSSIPYGDTPRLSFNCWLNTSANTKFKYGNILATVLLRGALRVSHPAITPGSAADNA